MTADEIKDRLIQRVITRAEEILVSKAKTFSSLLKYEITVTNVELAMESDGHGYNFKFIPESYADGAVLSPVVAGEDKLEMKLTIPQHVFKNASDEEIAFFKTFIVPNATKRFKQMN